jgi:hypothetical protein
MVEEMLAMRGTIVSQSGLCQQNSLSGFAIR